MGAYISEFSDTWAVIWTDSKGNVHVEEYYTEESAQQALESIKA